MIESTPSEADFAIIETKIKEVERLDALQFRDASGEPCQFLLNWLFRKTIGDETILIRLTFIPVRNWFQKHAFTIMLSGIIT